jgi:hypothetical protein
MSEKKIPDDKSRGKQIQNAINQIIIPLASEFFTVKKGINDHCLLG